MITANLDELKNIPRRTFHLFDPLMTIFDSRSASLDHVVLVIQLVFMLTSSADIYIHVSRFNHESIQFSFHTLAPLLRDVLLLGLDSRALLLHAALGSSCALFARAKLSIGKLVDEQPLPRRARSNDTPLDAQLLLESLVVAVRAVTVAADSSSAHCDGVDVVIRDGGELW